MKTVMSTMSACAILLSACLCACSPNEDVPNPGPPTDMPGNDSDSEDPGVPPQSTVKMKITIGATSFTATLADNPAADVFRTLLPLVATMGELNDNEKYYYLPRTLPATPPDIGTIHSGDIMLYGSNCLVLFYKTFPSSYQYTRIGSIDNPSALEMSLGSGQITLRFELINNQL